MYITSFMQVLREPKTQSVLFRIISINLKITSVQFPSIAGRDNAGDAELNISDWISPGHGQRGCLRSGTDTDRMVE